MRDVRVEVTHFVDEGCELVGVAHIGAGVALEHDELDSLALQHVCGNQPGGAGTHDRNRGDIVSRRGGHATHSAMRGW